VVKELIPCLQYPALHGLVECHEQQLPYMANEIRDRHGRRWLTGERQRGPQETGAYDTMIAAVMPTTSTD
jgi:hypothetical protein